MPLRCLLFSPDAEALRMIGQVLTELEIEGEACFQAIEAVEKVTARPFQIVIIDWSSQPDAGFLLNTARNRKPAERPLTLAIVSDDASVPTALQAGANSVLRKPLLANQVKDTLATARDLLRSKLEAPGMAASSAAAATSAASAMLPMEVQSTLRHTLPHTLHPGEFLQPSGSAPSAQFDTESSDVQKSMDQAAAAEIDLLKDLEPTAAPVLQSTPAPAQSAAPVAPREVIADDEPRGLAWYLKSRAKSLPADELEPQSPSAQDQAQLLGYDQTPSNPIAPTPEENSAADATESAEPRSGSPGPDPQQREEAALFAYITGDQADSEKEPAKPRPWIKKLAIAAAVVVAGGLAYFTVPKAVVQKDLKAAARAGHGWLNPQPSTPPQVQAHESFGRAGDEYKLPVAENIPDANTDPSQIRVLPVVDPTAKTPNAGTLTPDQSAAQANPTIPASSDPTQADPNQVPAGQVPESQVPAGQVPAGASQTPDQATQNQAAQTPVPQNQIQTNQAQATQTSTAPAQPQTVAAASDQAQGSATQGSTAQAVNPNSSGETQTGAARIPTPAVQTTQSLPAVSLQPVRNISHPAASGSNAHTPNLAGIPSSLKSSMAQMTPEASGNKPPEAALPSIEPVNLPEATVRGLLLQGPAPVYPPSARGASGSVVLQVLIGRDGTVQDAKFLQGSLAFARPAIDAVKQWRFKPYLMNGRPASTQTVLTLGFRPSS